MFIFYNKKRVLSIEICVYLGYNKAKSYNNKELDFMKIGIVGLGYFSDDFVRLFNIHPDVEEVVVADLDEKRVKASMEKHHLKRGFSSFEEMLEQAPDLDCIGIYTQRHLHGPMIAKAMKMGKNVISAVPIGCSVEEIEEIIKLSKEMGKFVYGESQYYHDICEMYLDFQHTGGPNWRRVAGIPPMFYPTHSISMLFSAINEHALKVSCMGYRDNHEDNIYGEDKNNWQNPFSNETALFQMSGGGIARINEFRRVGINKPSSYITCMYGEKASYECSVTNHSYQIGVASGKEPYIEDVGNLVNTIAYNEDLKNGKIDMNRDPISTKYIVGFAAIQDRSRLPKTFRNNPKFAHYNTHPFLVDDFVRAATTGKLPPNNAWDAARYMIPGLIAHESALKGGVLLDVPDFGAAPENWEKITYDLKDSYEDTSRFYEVEKGYLDV